MSNHRITVVATNARFWPVGTTALVCIAENEDVMLTLTIDEPGCYQSIVFKKIFDVTGLERHPSGLFESIGGVWIPRCMSRDFIRVTARIGRDDAMDVVVTWHDITPGNDYTIEFMCVGESNVLTPAKQAALDEIIEKRRLLAQVKPDTSLDEAAEEHEPPKKIRRMATITEMD